MDLNIVLIIPCFLIVCLKCSPEPLKYSQIFTDVLNSIKRFEMPPQEQECVQTYSSMYIFLLLKPSQLQIGEISHNAIPLVHCNRAPNLHILAQPILAHSKNQPLSHNTADREGVEKYITSPRAVAVLDYYIKGICIPMVILMFYIVLLPYNA